MTQKVISGVYNGVTTVELDTLAAETAASMTTKHPDYAILAARIAVSNLHKETKKTFTGGSLLKQIPATRSIHLPPLPSPPLPSPPLPSHTLSVAVVMRDLYEYTNPLNGKHSPMVSKEFLDIVIEHADVST